MVVLIGALDWNLAGHSKNPPKLSEYKPSNIDMGPGLLAVALLIFVISLAVKMCMGNVSNLRWN